MKIETKFSPGQTVRVRKGLGTAVIVEVGAKAGTTAPPRIGYGVYFQLGTPGHDKNGSEMVGLDESEIESVVGP